ncbi:MULTISPECIES: hypothetical protein [unclassified Mesorhizobium]|uniref:hypothetical protein n=1 Tax=unclassified Mesorhizobium TaxID=325217 RepID=UPI000419B539|nr:MULTISPECIES: hypothetical protein [unclassified Mesorhizobium]
MDSADSFLPFQDWRWLVTRRGADEKPVISYSADLPRRGSIFASFILCAETQQRLLSARGRTKVTAN